MDFEVLLAAFVGAVLCRTLCSSFIAVKTATGSLESRVWVQQFALPGCARNPVGS